MRKDISDKCKDYYKNGYTDWVILSAIFNCMTNWKAKEQGLDIIRDEDKTQFSKLENSIQNTVYPTILFLGQELDERIKIHNFISLKTYGFEIRQNVLTPEIVACIEKFLRYRMKHFDLDLPHSLLFGEPPGDWPNLIITQNIIKLPKIDSIALNLDRTCTYRQLILL